MDTCRSPTRLQLGPKVSINSFGDLCTGQYGEWCVCDFRVELNDKWLDSMLTCFDIEILFYCR